MLRSIVKDLKEEIFNVERKAFHPHDNCAQKSVPIIFLNNNSDN